jgi:6-phosphogluconolactonase
MAKKNPEMLIYMGSYTRQHAHVHGRAEGIYAYRLDSASGALTYTNQMMATVDPSFVAIEPQNRYLYAVNEVAEFAGQSGGAISAFAIDAQTGGLTLLNQQPSHGAAPCHLSVDQTGKYVLVANYGGGSVAMFPIREDGRLGEATDFIQHAGSSVNPQRQAGPHAHSITIDPANRFAFAADLGLDKIMIYRLDLDRGKLVPNDVQPWVEVQAGAGPRHFDFHPSARYAYVINELDSTMTAFAYDAANGTLQEIQTVSTLPAGFTGRNYTADVHVHPSGKFVYGSNRGHDSIVIFAIDEDTGKLTLVGHEPTQGETPRNFAIDSTGTFLLAANQNSDTVVTFRIDQGTGKLEPTGHVAEVPTPVCLKLIRLRK